MSFKTEWSEIFSNLLMATNSLIPIIRFVPRDHAFKDDGTIMFTAKKVDRNNRFDDSTNKRCHLAFSELTSGCTL